VVTHKLGIIPEPQENTRTVYASNPDVLPVIKGETGDIDLACGNCGVILVSKITTIQQIENIVIKCPQCDEFNDVTLIL